MTGGAEVADAGEHHGIGGHGRLVAAVFHDFTLTPPIPIGAKSTFTAPADGQLFLRCDDDWSQLGDNEGKIEVVIRRP
jgi:transketolase C-terminal domain/subunit